MKRWPWKSAPARQRPGVRTLVTMKHVGVNVAADPLMTLAYVGTEGGHGAAFGRRPHALFQPE